MTPIKGTTFSEIFEGFCRLAPADSKHLRFKENIGLDKSKGWSGLYLHDSWFSLGWLKDLFTCGQYSRDRQEKRKNAGPQIWNALVAQYGNAELANKVFKKDLGCTSDDHRVAITWKTMKLINERRNEYEALCGETAPTVETAKRSCEKDIVNLNAFRDSAAALASRGAVEPPNPESADDTAPNNLAMREYLKSHLRVGKVESAILEAVKAFEESAVASDDEAREPNEPAIESHGDNKVGACLSFRRLAALAIYEVMQEEIAEDTGQGNSRAGELYIALHELLEMPANKETLERITSGATKNGVKDSSSDTRQGEQFRRDLLDQIYHKLFEFDDPGSPATDQWYGKKIWAASGRRLLYMQQFHCEPDHVQQFAAALQSPIGTAITAAEARLKELRAFPPEAN